MTCAVTPSVCGARVPSRTTVRRRKPRELTANGGATSKTEGALPLSQNVPEYDIGSVSLSPGVCSNTVYWYHTPSGRSQREGTHFPIVVRA